MARRILSTPKKIVLLEELIGLSMDGILCLMSLGLCNSLRNSPPFPTPALLRLLAALLCSCSAEHSPPPPPTSLSGRKTARIEMRPLIRSVFARPTSVSFAVSTATKSHLRQQLSKVHNAKAVCLRCQFYPPPLPPPSPLWAQARFLSSDTNRSPATPKDAQTPSPRIAPKPPPPPPSLENLPSRKESRRSDLSKRISQGLDNFQTTLFSAGQKLNVLTGYSDIESLKKSIEAQGKPPSPWPRYIRC